MEDSKYGNLAVYIEAKLHSQTFDEKNQGANDEAERSRT